MLHKFFEEGDWFAQKRIGYGAGLPIAWQGWVLLIAYIALMGGMAITLEGSNEGVQILAITGMIIVTVLFIIITKKRTKGGWRWRP